MLISNLNSKYSQFQYSTTKFEANMREQLDIIQSLNLKINQSNEHTASFKKDTLDRFLSIEHEIEKQANLLSDEFNIKNKRLLELGDKVDMQL